MKPLVKVSDHAIERALARHPRCEGMAPDVVARFLAMAVTTGWADREEVEEARCADLRFLVPVGGRGCRAVVTQAAEGGYVVRTVLTKDQLKAGRAIGRYRKPFKVSDLPFNPWGAD